MLTPRRAGSDGFVRHLTRGVTTLNASTVQNARRLVALLATEDPEMSARELLERRAASFDYEAESAWDESLDRSWKAQPSA